MSPIQIATQQPDQTKAKRPAKICSQAYLKLLIPLCALSLSACESTTLDAENSHTSPITELELAVMETDIACESDELGDHYFKQIESLE